MAPFSQSSCSILFIFTIPIEGVINVESVKKFGIPSELHGVAEQIHNSCTVCMEMVIVLMEIIFTMVVHPVLFKAGQISRISRHRI